MSSAVLAFMASAGQPEQLMCVTRQGQFCSNFCEGNDFFDAVTLDRCQEQCLQTPNCTGGYWHPEYNGYAPVCKLYGPNISSFRCCVQQEHWSVSYSFGCRELEACASERERPTHDAHCVGTGTSWKVVLMSLVAMACLATVAFTILFCWWRSRRRNKASPEVNAGPGGKGKAPEP